MFRGPLRQVAFVKFCFVERNGIRLQRIVAQLPCEREERRGVDSTAEKQAHRHVADEMMIHAVEQRRADGGGILVEREGSRGRGIGGCADGQRPVRL